MVPSGEIAGKRSPLYPPELVLNVSWRTFVPSGFMMKTCGLHGPSQFPSTSTSEVRAIAPFVAAEGLFAWVKPAAPAPLLLATNVKQFDASRLHSMMLLLPGAVRMRPGGFSACAAMPRLAAGNKD